MANRGIQASGTGTVHDGPCNVMCMTTNLTTAGTLTLRDGGASGQIKATVDIAAGAGHYPIPFGLFFKTSLHVTYTTAAGKVTFWV